MIPNTPSEPSGSWDSIHVFEAAERGRQAHYKLTSTIMLQLVTHKGVENDSGNGHQRRQQQYGKSTSAEVGTEGNGKSKAEGWKKEGEVSLSGSMTRQVRYDLIFCFVSDI
jgi:capping protein beta